MLEQQFGVEIECILHPELTDADKTQINTNFQHVFGKDKQEYVRDFANRQFITHLKQDTGIACNFRGYTHEGIENWKIVTDSSITSFKSTWDCGLELVSPILNTTGDGFTQIKKICGTIHKLNGYVNHSCGLHVHIDASVLDLDTIRALVVNYYLIQKALDKFLPIHRGQYNKYCTKLGPTHIELISSLEKKDEINTNTLFMRGWGRLSLNLTDAYERHKTIEFRVHQGTVDYRKIRNWVTFISYLVEASKQKLQLSADLVSLLIQFEKLGMDERASYYFLTRVEKKTKLSAYINSKRNKNLSYR